MIRSLAVGVVLSAAVAIAQEGGDLDLVAGTQKVITVQNLQRVAIEDSSIADVKTIGAGQLLVIAVAPGKTELLVWKQSGDRIRYRVFVKPKPRPKPDGGAGAP